MNKEIIEQLQIALSPQPYIAFKKASGEEVLLLLSSIVYLTKNADGLLLKLSHGHTLEVMAADLDEFSKKIQEGIDFAIKRNEQLAMQALLSAGKMSLS